MTNIQKLAAEGNKNHRIFAATVVDLMNSQGFYGRLYRSINELDDDSYEQFFELIGEQNSKIRWMSYSGSNVKLQEV